MPINPKSLENLKPPWGPENPPNRAGRPSAGATIREHMNGMTQSGTDEATLRKIAKDKSAPVGRRMAAIQLLKAIEVDDLSDFDPYVEGAVTLSELRASGVDTSVVKKAKVTVRSMGEQGTETTREIEVRDRAGDALDKIIGHTAPTMNEQEKNERLDAGKATGSEKIEVVYVDRITPKNPD